MFSLPSITADCVKVISSLRRFRCFKNQMRTWCSSNKDKKLTEKTYNTPHAAKDPPDGYNPECVKHDEFSAPEFKYSAVAFREFSDRKEVLGPDAGKTKHYKNPEYFAYHRFSFSSLQVAALEARKQRQDTGALRRLYDSDENDGGDYNVGDDEALETITTKGRKKKASASQKLKELTKSCGGEESKELTNSCESQKSEQTTESEDFVKSSEAKESKELIKLDESKESKESNITLSESKKSEESEESTKSCDSKESNEATDSKDPKGKPESENPPV